MSPITHFLAGRVGFKSCLRNQRDRAIVCLAGLAPDFYGAGIAIDLGNKLAGLPESNFYHDWHHLYGHGITAAMVLTPLAAAIGQVTYILVLQKAVIAAPCRRIRSWLSACWGQSHRYH